MPPLQLGHLNLLGPQSPPRCTGYPRLTLVIMFVGLLCLLAAVRVDANELSYKPINPKFGGNPFNDGISLGAANVQNPYEQEKKVKGLIA